MSLKSINEIINIAERQGVTFQSAVDVSIPEATPLVTFFRSGDKPVIIFTRKISYTGDGVTLMVYRDAEFTGGTPIESFSANDLVKKDAESSFYSGATEVSAGIETRAPIYLFGNASRQGQGAANQAINEPQILPPNSVYRFTIESRSGTQQVSSQLEWAEVENIEGLSFASGEWVYVGEELKI